MTPIRGALLLCALLAVSTLLLAQLIRNEVREEKADTLQTLRDMAAAAVELEVRGEMELVELLASTPDIQRRIQALIDGEPGALDELRERLNPIIRTLGYEGFFVIDEDDRSVGSMRDTNLHERNPLASQPEFLTRVRGGVPSVSQPMGARVRQSADVDGHLGPTMFVGAPVRAEDGEVIAVLTLRVDPRVCFGYLTESSAFETTGETYVFARDGMMLTTGRHASQAVELGLAASIHEVPLGVALRDPGVDLATGAAPATPIAARPFTFAVAAAIGGSEGVNLVGYRDYRGVLVVGAWTWLDDLGLGVLSEQEASEAWHSLQLMQRALWLGWLFSSLLVLVFGIQLSRARRRLVAVNTSLESRVEERTRAAEAASAAKSEFLARMSHEIRTPLNAVLGMAHLARRDAGEAHIQRQLSRIEASGNSLLGIVNDILDFSKIEAGALELESLTFDLEGVLRDVAGLEAMASPDVEFVFDVGGDVPRWLVGDPTRFRQVLTNLVGNAFKFTKQGSVTLRVRVLARTDDAAELEFTVIDTGIGLDPERAESLFAAFQQADGTTTRAYGGTGLGLSISRRIAEAMGGSVDASGQLGVGAVFRFTARFGASERSRGDTDVLTTLAGKRVLVVDDSPVWRSILSDTVSSFGLVVTTASSGDEAVALLESGQSFDIAIVDWLMPGLDGLETSERLMSEGGASVVVMVTSADRARLRSAARSRSLPRVLSKPFTRSALLDTLLVEMGEAPFERSSSQSEPGAMPPAGTRVLLVEDHPINQEVGFGILEGAGAHVDIASNGVLALKALERAEYDVVLMDVQMPVMDGWEATLQIRSEPAHVDLPIIAMTADVLTEDRQRCLDVGMNDYLAKPFAPSKLLAIVAKWVRKMGGPKYPASDEAPRADISRLNAPPGGMVRADESVTAPAASWASGRRPLASTSSGARMNPRWRDAVDRELALQSLGGDADMWFSLLESFDDELERMLSVVELRTEVDDPEATARVLHTLKGLAATLGGRVLAELAAELEGELDAEGRLQGEELAAFKNAVDAFRASSARIRAAGDELVPPQS